MKLTKEQKDTLFAMKATWAKEVDAKTITVPDVVTIAWARPFPNAKMITVATSYYDQTETDRFRRKTGEFYALVRLTAQYPQYMQLPLGEQSDEMIEAILVDMFVV
jgi:hypothetical protein